MPSNPHIEALFRERYVDKRTGKRRKIPRLPRRREPRTLERKYLRDIVRMLNIAHELVRQELITRMPELEAEALQTFDSVRQDNWVDLFRDIFEETIRIRFGQIVPDTAVRALSNRQAGEIDTFNENQINQQFRKILGLDIVGSLTVDLSATLDAFNESNVGLIKSIPEKYLDDVKEMTLRNFRAGNRFSEWSKDLEDRFGVSKSRAALIARDQTNKLNGELNQIRNQELGLDEYTWRTSMDERVRESHKVLEGRVFSYTDPEKQPPEGHPGQPIQCRCQAEPNVEAALDRLGV